MGMGLEVSALASSACSCSVQAFAVGVLGIGACLPLLGCLGCACASGVCLRLYACFVLVLCMPLASTGFMLVLCTRLAVSACASSCLYRARVWLLLPAACDAAVAAAPVAC